MQDSITEYMNAKRSLDALERARANVCDSFAKGELDFPDAFYRLTNEPSCLTPRMATAYLAGAKIAANGPMSRA